MHMYMRILYAIIKKGINKSYELKILKPVYNV